MQIIVESVYICKCKELKGIIVHVLTEIFNYLKMYKMLQTLGSGTIIIIAKLYQFLYTISIINTGQMNTKSKRKCNGLDFL